uniref:Uncharacterized protein n=1 Tax=Arundo donax TaxID=35708 RepID=A0A0A9BV64_ARUDO
MDYYFLGDLGRESCEFGWGGAASWGG